MATVYKTLSDHAILIEFGKKISPELLQKVMGLDILLQEQDIYGVIETVPAYASLAVFYNPLIWEEEDLIQTIKGLELSSGDVNLPVPQKWEIPVIYDPPGNPDMQSVIHHTGLSYEAIIEIHQRGEYLVYMLGFLPGFIYLGGMDPRLSVPRKKVPDLKTPAGSVAIGGAQTGIYALESPAGWHIIGHTDMTFFDSKASPPAKIKPGDRVVFVNG
ncbi:MAG: allophanate hydrolase subunit 1 [Bacteroidetes bacterium]|nr:MAG: allophanate hydrolase subunit 1 [Bacteroidota bacterium]